MSFPPQGEVATTGNILDKAVTYAKIQDVSATDKILGRASALAGVVEEIDCNSFGRALLDDASVAAQRTTLGLVAGGDGDIWVEKAGDTMSGNLVFSGAQKIIGGTGVDSDLTLQTTSGVGAAGADMHFLVGNNGATEAVTILNSGNVGIGTASPGAPLQIYRTVTGTAANLAETVTQATLALNRFRPDVDMGLFFGIGDPNIIYIQGTNNAGDTTKNIVINPYGGNVGIGQTSPSAKLDIVATDAENATALEVNQLDIASAVAATVINAGTGDGLFLDQNGNGVALHIDNDGTANSITVEGTTTTDLVLNKTGELYGAVISNQYSNLLSGDLLGMFSTLKFLNTLTGTPATDAANMIDVSGAGHNGTYKGTWAAAQRINKGFGWMLSPNGTDNYITLGDSDDFSFGDGLNDSAFTIAGVIEVIDDANSKIVAAKYDETTGAELREWRVILHTDEMFELGLYDESANVTVRKTTNASLSSGFHSYVITYSGVGGATAANGITIYVDGAAVASTSTNNASYVATENLTAATLIGAQVIPAGTVGYFYPGDFTPPIIDKGTVWTAAQVNRFHQYMKGIYNL